MVQHENRKTVFCVVLFSAVELLLAFIAPLLGGSPSKPGLGYVLWGTSPLLVSVLMRLVTKDWKDAGWKPLFKKNIRWYFLAIFAFPAMTLLTFFIGQVTKTSSLSGFVFAPFMKTFLTAIPVFIVFAVFEEVGWRGYLVPKLNAIGLNPILAAALVSIVWSTWHLPYISELSWVYSSEKLATFIPRFFLAMFAFAILYNEIRMITGSVWPAILMHGVMNAFGHPLSADYAHIQSGSEFFVSSTGLLMIAFAGLLGLTLYRWRVKMAKGACLTTD